MKVRTVKKHISTESDYHAVNITKGKTVKKIQMIKRAIEPLVMSNFIIQVQYES